FGWATYVGPLRKTTLRGLARVDFQCLLPVAGDSSLRMRNLSASSPGWRPTHSPSPAHARTRRGDGNMSWKGPNRAAHFASKVLIKKFDPHHVPYAFSEAFSTAC